MIKNIAITFISILIFTISCTVKEYRKVVIPYSINNRSDLMSWKLKGIIDSAFRMESDAFRDFIVLSNTVEGESAYDLGYVLTQIIYMIGEDEFLKTINNLTNDEKAILISFINVGLEYGDNDYDNIQDNKRIEDEFPLIQQKLIKK
ncbi:MULTISPECIES: hypothetical protein [Empedobacter]|uniref:hypothetical protein n=1 Tax=Empedobacter TaxID=59734 RepID=UPI002447303E|nr:MULTISPECIES: hypothetical protein [Empedobacter]MDH1881774.1 hypothetical protein [Empedobacter sp. GD03797]MDM1041371.1 hypothetical protein [Empedobacter brevis]MDM1134950.1 hypothetical protein [Empedobacter sp. R750]